MFGQIVIDFACDLMMPTVITVSNEPVNIIPSMNVETRMTFRSLSMPSRPIANLQLGSIYLVLIETVDHLPYSLHIDHCMIIGDNEQLTLIENSKINSSLSSLITLPPPIPLRPNQTGFMLRAFKLRQMDKLLISCQIKLVH